MQTGNIPPLVVEAIGNAAVSQHGEWFLKRGGSLGRARSEVQKGNTIPFAAVTAARQGKGHMAELRQAAELTTNAGWTFQPYWSRPNPVANDPHIDLEVLKGPVRVNGAQVGVGRPEYLAQKAQRSMAPQVVINTEAREEMRQRYPDAFARTTDHISHNDTRAHPLSGERAEEEARQILEHSLRGEPMLGLGAKAGLAVGAGAQSFIWSFGQGMLFEVVEAIAQGRGIDPARVKQVLAGSAENAARTILQTSLLVENFLTKAGTAYKGKLLHAAARRTVLVGAVVDVIISTAKDVVKWIQHEISFEDLLRRAGVNVFSAGGAALGALGAAYLSRGMPWWAQVFTCVLAGWAGSKLGTKVGEVMFLPGAKTMSEANAT